MNDALRQLIGPELQRRIALLAREAERFPEMAEAGLLERSRLERVFAEKRAAKKQARPAGAAA